MEASIVWHILVVITLYNLQPLQGYNILAFYPYPAKSHHMVYWPLLKELVIRGHNVTMLSPLSMPNPPTERYKELKVADISGKLSETEGFTLSNDIVTGFVQNTLFFLKMGELLTRRILQEPVFQWLIKSDSQFDLIFTELTFGMEAFSALHHRFSAVNVELTSYGNSHWTYWVHGQPFDPSYIADSDTWFSDRMTFTERFQNNFQSLAIRSVNYFYYMRKYQELMDKHIRYPGWENRPDIMTLLRNTSLVLMNTHYSLNYPYPNSPHVKEIGGINLQSPKPLPQDIQDFMDKAVDGVIYFSLGSVLPGSNVIDEKTRDIFIDVFSRLKQRVLWKWELPITNLPSNVRVSSWLPQQSILAHKNCKMFISHAGFLSTTEAMYYGVPVVSIPIWADQLRNSKQMTSAGYAIELQFENLTRDSIEYSLNEVLFKPKYKENAMKQSNIFKDKPETALETAVYWTEYVIRHKGAEHLRPAIASMPWYQQAMIDVYSAMAAIVLIPIYLSYRIVRFLCRCCSSKKGRQSKKKKE